MKNLLNFQRTKMIDEASVNHKPAKVFSTLLPFLLVVIIAEFISGALQSIPSLIFMLSSGEYWEALKGYTNGVITMDEMLDVLNAIASTIPPWLVACSLIATVSIIAVSIFYCIKFEKRPLSSMGIRRKNAAREYFLGLFIGLLMVGFSFLIAFLTGSVTVTPGSFEPVIILFLIGFIIQGASEEILVRGYLMVSLARDYRPAFAVAISSVAFSLLHLGNPGVGLLPLINITLMGIFLGIYVFKRGDLWGACAIHTIWNFTLGNIFGVSVSGLDTVPSLLISVSNERLALINGGAFGLEGGVAVTLILLVSIALVLLVKQNPKEISDVRVDFFE